jgi:hypothetical protein
MLSHPVVDAVAMAPVNLPLVLRKKGAVCLTNVGYLTALPAAFDTAFDFWIQQKVI